MSIVDYFTGNDYISSAANTATAGGEQGMDSYLMGTMINAQATLEAAGIAAAASQSAANSQLLLGREGLQQAQAQFNETMDLQRPWYETGARALDKLEALTNPGAPSVGAPPEYEYMQAPGGPDDYEKSPYYDWLQEEQVKALDRSASSRGRLSSGAQDKAVLEYGKNLASTDYDNWLRRYYDEAKWDTGIKQQQLGDYYDRSNFALNNYYNSLKPYQSLAGVGQTTANAMGNASMAYGQNASNLLSNLGTGQANLISQAGQQQAAGVAGAGNIWGNYYTAQGNNAINSGNIMANSQLAQGANTNAFWGGVANNAGAIAEGVGDLWNYFST